MAIEKETLGEAASSKALLSVLSHSQNCLHPTDLKSMPIIATPLPQGSTGTGLIAIEEEAKIKPSYR
jgi:hypothetical protein